MASSRYHEATIRILVCRDGFPRAEIRQFCDFSLDIKAMNSPCILSRSLHIAIRGHPRPRAPRPWTCKAYILRQSWCLPASIKTCRSFEPSHTKEDRLLDNADESVTELASLRPQTSVIHSGNQPRPPAQICFDRKELMTILNIYGRMVAAGEWRDYAIDTLKDRAIFSIYRRTSEMPVYPHREKPQACPQAGGLQFGLATGTDPQARSGPRHHHQAAQSETAQGGRNLI